MHIAIDIPGIEFGSELGHGAHSVVYRGTLEGRPCAIKIPRTRGAWTRWIYREAVALARVADLGLPSVLEVGEVEGRPYLVMELVEGETLGERLRRLSFDEREAIAVARELLRILQRVHDAGLVHRDVKPRNIIVQPSGAVRLIDFGFATPIERTSAFPEIAGTPSYASPEQMLEPTRVDGRADLYSVGCVLFECLTGQLPSTIRESSGEPSTVMELLFGLGTSQPLAEVIVGLLEPDPDRRYPDAESARSDLERADSGMPVVGSAGFRARPKSTPFVGRRTELLRIARAADGVTDSGGRAVIIEGTRGSGKTRLVRAAHGEWLERADGRSVVLGCYEGQSPLATLRALLEGLVNARDGARSGQPSFAEQVVAATPRELSPFVSMVAPALAVRLGIVGGGVEPMNTPLPEGVAELVVRWVHAVGPVFVAIDDFQWCDPASRDVLLRVAHRVRDSPLLLMLASRGEGSGASARDVLLSNLEQTTRVVIALESFGDRQIEDLITAHLGVPVVDSSLVARVVSLCEPTPLGVLELVEAFLDVGALRPYRGTWTFDAPRAETVSLPEGAQALLGRRLAELVPAMRELVNAASVLGSTFDDELLAQVLEVDGSDLQFGLSALRRSRLLERAGPAHHRFVHDSFREVLLDGLSEETSRTFHQRAAEGLHQIAQPDFDQLCATALHFHAGHADQSPGAALAVSREAARGALERYDNTTALQFLAIAERFAELAEVPLDGQFYRERGEACLRLGALEESLGAFTTALSRTVAPLERARLHGRIAWVHQSDSDPEPAWQALAQAFEALGCPMPDESPHSAGASVLVLLRTGLAALKGAPRAEAVPPETELLCDLHYQSARLGLEYGKPSRFVQSTIRTVNLSRSLPPCRALARSRAMSGFVLTSLGQRRAGARMLGDAHKMADALHDPATTAFCGRLLALAACWAGEMDEALRLYRVGFDERGPWIELSEYCLDAANADLIEAVRGRAEHSWVWNQRVLGRARRSRQPTAAFVQYLIHRAHASLVALGRDVTAEPWLAEQLQLALAHHPGAEQGFLGMLSWGSRARSFTECADFGPALQQLIEDFEQQGYKAGAGHPVLCEYYIAIAHARVHQCIQASGPDRHGRVRDLHKAADDLRAAAKLDLFRSHAVLIDGYCAFFDGDAPRAKKLFAQAEELALEETCPWVLYGVARGRAHLLASKGLTDAARDQARVAEAVAQQHHAVHRAQWIRDEFDLPSLEIEKSESRRSMQSASVRQTRRQLAAVLRMLRASSRELQPKLQARAILDELNSDLDAERGCLWFQPDLGSPSQVTVELDRAGTDTRYQASGWREVLLKSVRQQPDLWPPLGGQSDVTDQLAATESAQRIDRMRVLAAPLFLNDRQVGAVCFERSPSAPSFDANSRELLTVLAQQIPLALEMARLLAERDHLQASFMQAQKMEAVGQLAGGIAHDFNNMLGAIMAALETLQGQVPNELGLDSDFKIALEASTRASELTQQLLSFSRHQPPASSDCDLDDVVWGIGPMLARVAGAASSVDIKLANRPAAIRLDRPGFEQVLVNLVVNARDAMAPSGGNIQIAVSVVNLDGLAVRRGIPKPGTYGLISVEDDGPGMREEVASRIFEPFFTTKPQGRGTGLGLATAYAFAKNAGGHIEVSTALDQGTKFHLYLPLRSTELPATLAATSADDAVTVLVVDDEELVARSVGRVLEASGYRVLVANSGAEALKYLEGQGDEISLGLVDVRMPLMNGIELGRKIQQRGVSTKLAFMSGFIPAGEPNYDYLQDHPYIQKPFSHAELLRLVQSVLAH